MLLDEFEDISVFLNSIRKHDVLKTRSELMDNDATRFHSMENIQDVFLKTTQGTPYQILNNLTDISVLGGIKIDLKKIIYRFIARLRAFSSDYSGSNQQRLEEFIRYLYYFFDMSGEKLFNMERAYKLKCYKAVSEIERMGIVSDLKMFRRTATSGQNPRRFAAFSNSKLQLLTKKNNREKVSKCYRIPLTDNKEFDTSQSVDSDNLVKILCGKAMWDVLEDIPVEVDGSKDWVS